MALTGISNRGLLAIAFLVAILWGCILGARVTERRAIEETEALLRSGRKLQVAKPEKPTTPRPPFPVTAFARAVT